MQQNKVQIVIEALNKAKGALNDLQKDLKGVGTEGQSTQQKLGGLGGTLSFLKENWVGLSVGINQALEAFGK